MTDTTLLPSIMDTAIFSFGDTGNEVATHDSIDLPANSQAVTLSFDLLEIDSWDGETFFIVINGQRIDLGSFSSSEDEAASSFDAGNGITVEKTAAVDIAPTGSSGQLWHDNDNSHTFTITINNPGDTLDIGFGSSLNQSVGDESWSVQNFNITSQISTPVAGEVKYTFEAENMVEIGFYDAGASKASGNMISKTGADSGWLEQHFDGEAGTYDLALFLQDEADGQSTINVLVNGQSVGTVVMDRDSDGWGSDNGSFSEFVVSGVDLSAGDQIRFEVSRDGGEFVRFDKMELRSPETVVTSEVDLTKVQTLDFEGLARGTVVTDQFEGVQVTVTGGSNEAMVFDSSNPTGGDYDLATASQGMVLIISEDGDSDDPDDNWSGGKFVLEFAEPAQLLDMVFIDTEEGGNIEMFNEFGDLIKVVDIPLLGDGETGTANLNADGVSFMVVNMAGSGAIDDVRFIPASEPEPEDVVVAVDDEITVWETETFGDFDGQVLINDTKNGEAYPGTVHGVEGDASNIGVEVVGSNGGLARIFENGLIDFSANDEFDHLLVGESETTTFTYFIENGATATVTVNVLGENEMPPFEPPFEPTFEPTDEPTSEPPIWMVF